MMTWGWRCLVMGMRCMRGLRRLRRLRPPRGMLCLGLRPHSRGRLLCRSLRWLWPDGRWPAGRCASGWRLCCRRRCGAGPGPRLSGSRRWCAMAAGRRRFWRGWRSCALIRGCWCRRCGRLRMRRPARLRRKGEPFPATPRLAAPKLRRSVLRMLRRRILTDAISMAKAGVLRMMVTARSAWARRSC